MLASGACLGLAEEEPSEAQQAYDVAEKEYKRSGFRWITPYQFKVRNSSGFAAAQAMAGRGRQQGALYQCYPPPSPAPDAHTSLLLVPAQNNVDLATNEKPIMVTFLSPR